MMQRVTEISVDGDEPLTPAEAKTFLKVTNTLEDSLIAAQIKVVRLLFERLTKRTIVAKHLKLTYDTIPGAGSMSGLPWWDGVREMAWMGSRGRQIQLPKPPLFAPETVEIATYDLVNVRSVYDPINYFIDCTDQDQQPRICLNYGAIWPPNLRPSNSFEVLYQAGYPVDATDPDNPVQTVPADIKQAMLLMLSWIFNNRGDASDVGAKMSGSFDMLRPYIIVEPMLRPETNRLHRSM